MPKKIDDRDVRNAELQPSYIPRGKPKYVNTEAESGDDLHAHYGSENSQSQSEPYYVATKRGRDRYNEYR